MFLSSKRRNIDKQLTKGEAYKEAKNGDAIISINAPTNNELFSSYNYNSDDVINKDLADYIWQKSKLVPFNHDIKLQIYTKEEVDKKEVKSALNTYYRAEYLDAKSELKKNTIFSLLCLFFGVVTLVVLSLFNSLIDNFYLLSITDILAWVFIWEAFDVFFFQRSHSIRRIKQIQRLYKAKLEIIKTI